MQNIDTLNKIVKEKDDTIDQLKKEIENLRKSKQIRFFGQIENK
jgi:predicted RNase H-like nuclease (RuvC/YqgF family)